MTTTIDIREEALTLRRGKKYAEALPLYRRMWEHDREACTLWDAWGYALCLKQTGHLAEALDMCRRIYRHDDTFEPARSLYAWCIFLSAMTGPPAEDEAAMLKAAGAIVQLCRPGDPGSPLAPAVLKAAACYMGRATPNPDKALEWLDKLDPAGLSAGGRSIQTPDGKTVAQASPREQYYGLRIKALFVQGHNEACADFCRRALNDLPAFHYDNDLWFRRYLAQSLLRTDQAQEARELYAYILPRRREWFLLKEAGDVCAALGETKMAAYFHLSAAVECRDPDKAVRLLELLAERCLREDDTENARRHLSAACRLRTERQWSIPLSLAELADRCQFDTAQLPEGNFRQEWRKLQDYWNQALDLILPPLHGVVSRLLPGNRAGFVQCDKDRKAYFFQAAQFQGRREELAEGLAVRFRIETGYDAKKDKVVLNAVGIRPG